MNNWDKLKLKINEQLTDIKNHSSYSGNWRTYGRVYLDVLKLMKAVEDGTADDLIPHNCLWKTKEELDNELSGTNNK